MPEEKVRVDVAAPDRVGVEELPEQESVETPVETSPDVSVVTYDAVYNAVYDALQAQEASETVTDGQIVNSTALSFFEGILSNQKLPVDYVIYTGDAYTYWNNSYERTAYEYCMVYGDLDLSGTTFSGEDLTVVRMRTSGDVSVNYNYNQSVSVNAPVYYSRSNLGSYSGIIQYDYDGYVLLVFAVLGGVIWLMQKLMCLKR